MKAIQIQVIAHNGHRIKNTAGDYFEYSPGHWGVLVSDLGDWRLSMVLAVHELVEFLCTQAHGIGESRITAWDRKMTRRNPDLEPGEQPGCPYGREHRFAEKIERMVAREIGVKWRDYLKALEDLWQPHPAKSAPRVTKK